MRILFTSSPGLGHVHPMVPLAMALAGRGHDVRWAVAAEAGPRLEAAGFATFPAGMGVAERDGAFRRLQGEPGFNAAAGKVGEEIKGMPSPDAVGTVLEGLF